METKTEKKPATTKPDVVKKPKSSRNTEKRRERSKVAARCRRGKESEIFTELSNSLPVSESSRASLDKASVMRLTLCDLKLKEMIESVEGLKQNQSKIGNLKDVDDFEALINNAVSGFVLVCSCDGDVIYVSDGIASCLGLSQYEVMGQNLLEYCHPCDQGDVNEMLMMTSSSGGGNKLASSSPDVESRIGLFRLKSTNSTRGRNVHHRTSNYKVVSCCGRVFTGDVSCGTGDLSKKWFVGVCEPLLHPSDVDIPLNKQTFLSKHSPDMKFDYVDESISDFMGYKEKDLVGKSLFDFYHAGDGDGVARSFKSLYSKGQTVTERSRFLAKGGGWVWVVTQATSINNNAGKPTSIVCIHFLASGVECPDELLSHVQLRDANDPIPVKPVPIAVEACKKQPLHESTNLQKDIIPIVSLPVAPTTPAHSPEPLAVSTFAGPILSKPTPSTAKIFAPRTEDMDSGFLMPVNDTLIVTKDEPADLTHLAPIAGDECVSLSNVPLLDDLLEWLDVADMEYTVLEGYDEPLPLPLIAAISDTPIPMSLTMSPTTSEIFVKNDVILGSMPSPQCDSPLLMRNIDPNLMSSQDPLLLSPFKTSSPEPSPPSTSASCMDILNPDLFSSLYDKEIGGGGGTLSSSDKCKDGGFDEPFSGFPIVSDFHEQLFSPGATLDVVNVGKPTSPLVHSLVMDTGGSAGPRLGSKLMAVDGLHNSSGQPYGAGAKEAETSLGRLKYMVTSNNHHSPSFDEIGQPRMDDDRQPPCKVAKSSFSDQMNKVWLHPAGETPPQPPWKIVGVPQHSPPQSLICSLGTPLPTKRSTCISTGTQTFQFRAHTLDQRHLKYRQLLRNPLVIQALMNRTLTSATGQNLGRKRNFLGKLLTNGGHMRAGMGLFGSCDMSSLVELTNQDCEVNAPLESKPLLDGPDILTALDTAGHATDVV